MKGKATFVKPLSVFNNQDHKCLLRIPNRRDKTIPFVQMTKGENNQVKENFIKSMKSKQPLIKTEGLV